MGMTYIDIYIGDVETIDGKEFIRFRPGDQKCFNVPKSYLLPTVGAVFENVRVVVPVNARDFLEDQYGKDFMIPSSKKGKTCKDGVFHYDG
jgi:hypothetical protein